MTYRIEHCKKAAEFFIKFNTGSKAYLQYHQLPNRVLDFTHTVTPQDQQGKGIAKLLVQEGLKYANENNMQVRPTCSYVAKYFESDKASDLEKKLDVRHKL